jgi:hypothetical protein
MWQDDTPSSATKTVGDDKLAFEKMRFSRPDGMRIILMYPKYYQDFFLKKHA